LNISEIVLQHDWTW